MKLFHLKRCYLFVEIPFRDKHLVLINTHNSAYDSSGKAKAIQLDMLKKRMEDEFTRGNVVIAGGDWNQNPPDFDVHRIKTGDKVRRTCQVIPNDLMQSDWKWVYDPEYPTNRDVDIPYTKGITPVTLIDFFLVSPDVDVLEVKTLPVGFEMSDHQPVYMKIRIH